MPLETSEDICEALLRHTEMSGSEVFEKNFEAGGKIMASVWCIVGKDAESFALACREWLKENGYAFDGRGLE